MRKRAACTADPLKPSVLTTAAPDGTDHHAQRCASVSQRARLCPSVSAFRQRPARGYASLNERLSATRNG